MARAESQMWQRLRPHLLEGKLDPVRVENPIHPGTPDVNLCSGQWLELKTIEAWPVRDSSPVRIPHYTPQQRVWLYRRWRARRDSCYLLLEVRSVKHWLLFDGDVAAKVVGRLGAAAHRVNARAVLGSHELAQLPRVLAEVLD